MRMFEFIYKSCNPIFISVRMLDIAFVFTAELITHLSFGSTSLLFASMAFIVCFDVHGFAYFLYIRVYFISTPLMLLLEDRCIAQHSQWSMDYTQYIYTYVGFTGSCGNATVLCQIFEHDLKDFRKSACRT